MTRMMAHTSIKKSRAHYGISIDGISSDGVMPGVSESLDDVLSGPRANDLVARLNAE